MSPWLRAALFVPLAFLTAGVAQATQTAQAAEAPKAADPPAKVPDASVKARLDARELKYEVDQDGDYKLVFSFDEDKRSQIVFISGGTESVDDLAVREVFAPAARLKDDGVTGDKALELLADSRTRKLGAWEVDGDVLYYVMKLPDSVDAAQLEAAMNIVAQVADDMEIRFSGDRDDL